MSPQDHNKTLAILHAALGVFFTLGLLASPWIIAQNFRQREQIPLVIIIFGGVSVLTLLFWSTAIAMYRRKRVARKLAMISAIAVLPILWPVGVYSWWFIHSTGGSRLYGVIDSNRSLDKN